MAHLRASDLRTALVQGKALSLGFLVSDVGLVFRNLKF